MFQYISHRPILKTVLNLIQNKPVLELGCGEGSTDIIHHYCLEKNIKITTIDSDKTWLDRYSHYQTNLHDLIHLLDFNNWVPYLMSKNINWGLAFIDQGSWESRKECLFYLKDKVDYIILHDSCYFPKNNIFGKCTLETEPICCAQKLQDYCPCEDKIKNFKRTYDDVFLYSKEYISPYGPPTLLGSNFFNISNLFIEMC